MSSPLSSRVVPFKHRQNASLFSDDMPPFNLYNRRNSSSPVSSPLLLTPFASSSPPGQPRVQKSSRYPMVGDANDDIEDHDDISAVWGREYHGRGGPIRGIYTTLPAAFPFHSHDQPSRTSKSDAFQVKEHVFLDSHHLSPDDTDEEDEFEEFGDLHRQTYFATSSERGRWKSSPIPMKTYSRPFASTSSRQTENMTKLNKTANPNTRGRKDQRRPSTASSISDIPNSPITQTLPSMSEEPFSRQQTSSPLPPSSPPTSPISIALSMPESDEEDMLVDSDDERRYTAESAITVSLSFFLSGIRPRSF